MLLLEFADKIGGDELELQALAARVGRGDRGGGRAGRGVETRRTRAHRRYERLIARVRRGAAQQLRVHLQILVGYVQIAESELELGQLQCEQLENGKGKRDLHAAEAFYFEFGLVAHLEIGVHRLVERHRNGNYLKAAVDGERRDY